MSRDSCGEPLRQGGTADPLGFGVPVNIEGSWDDPRIYPDVAGILSDPDGAYSKLHALGQGLFGKGDGQSGGGMGACGWVPANDFKEQRKLHIVDMIRVGTS